MKNVKFIFVIICLLNLQNTQAQFLKKLGKKAKKTVESVLERKVDEKIEKTAEATIDTVLETPKKMRKRKSKPNYKQKEENIQKSMQQETIAQESNYDVMEEDSETKDQNKSYSLGNISFTVDGKTYTITNFGMDNTTEIIWFKPENGTDAFAGVVFKSSDFDKSTQINIADFDTMQHTYKGTKQIEDGMPIITFSSGSANYIFDSGVIYIEEFSRKTGLVKIKVKGKCTKTNVSVTSEFIENLDANLEIDAIMPYASINGMATLTEAASKLNINKPY